MAPHGARRQRADRARSSRSPPSAVVAGGRCRWRYGGCLSAARWRCCWRWRRRRLCRWRCAAADNPLWQAAACSISACRRWRWWRCAHVRRTARWIVIGPVPDRLGHRHRRAGVRQADRRPTLAPALSPGKTWAGTIGGSVTAALVFAALSSPSSAVDAARRCCSRFAFSVVAHGGDLFESLVKRRFGIKDSGGLIPGHGGVLDRMDSTFAASAGAGAAGVRACISIRCSGRMHEAHRRHPPLRRIAGAGRCPGAQASRCWARPAPSASTRWTSSPMPASIYGAEAFPIAALTARRQCRKC